jgi:DNA repair protein RadA/Sms
VPDLPQRVAEAARLGFRVAIVPAASMDTAGRSRIVDGLRVVEVGHIAEALRVTKLLGEPKQDATSRPGPGPRAIREGDAPF